jgi:hypothetical protein
MYLQKVIRARMDYPGALLHQKILIIPIQEKTSMKADLSSKIAENVD